MSNTGDGPANAADVPSDLVLDGADRRVPELTIAIPTFRRFDLLLQAVESAVGQAGTHAIEVIVVDNDPASQDAERLLAALPHLVGMNFRYYVNRTNIGMFGNWNRCIELGRGVWHSMLHDDDLLDAAFAATMLDTLVAFPEIDGLACRKRNLDQRPEAWQPSSGEMHRLRGTVADLRRFGLRDVRPITARQLFWANPIGNPVGFVCRRADALAIGGYWEQDYPSGDHFFFARFSRRFRLWQHRVVLASFRIAVNETMSQDNIQRLVLGTWRLQQQYAGTEVPAWWGRLSPLSAACEIMGWNAYWQARVDPEAVSRTIGRKLPRPRKGLYNLVLAILGGF